MEYDTPAVKDEFHKSQVEKFENQVVDTINAPGCI